MPRTAYRWVVAVLVLALALAGLPAAQAHAVVTVLDNEIHLLHDSADDSYALIDGYDVVDVYAREAWFPDMGEGVVFRFVLYGGFQILLPQAEELSLVFNLTAGSAPRAFVLHTTDGANWTGNMTLLDSRLTEEPLGDALVLQVFLSQAQMGAARGTQLTGFRLESRADGAVLDVAPGGRFLAGVEIPEESTRVTPALVLGGPFGYTRTGATLAGDRIQLNVTNLITVQEQHILLDMPPVAGWTVEPPAEAGYAVLANQSVTFALGATAVPGSADFLLYVISDLGGRERVTLTAPAPAPGGAGTGPPQPPAQVAVEQPPPPPSDDGAVTGEGEGTQGDGADGSTGSSDEGGQEPPAEDADTPGLGVGLILLTVAALAMAVRRR